MNGIIDSQALWLGAFVGAQVLVVFFCVIKANAYRERALLLHAAATLLSVLTVQSLIGRQPMVLPGAVFLLVPALAGLQLLDLVSHAGAVRTARRWLLGTSAVAMPLLAAGAAFHHAFLAVGLLVWAGMVGMMLARVWRQSQPWIWWLAPASVALLAAGACIALPGATDELDAALLVGGLLTAWSACVYLATGWRGRIQGETRARIKARNTIDPLTGLATPLVLHERVEAARHLTRRYGHPSVLMLVHIENLSSLAHEFGPEAAESAVLAAAVRVREALMRDGDVVARLTHTRMGVLAEGVAAGEAASSVASRILVAGLKEPLPSVKSEFLRFRIVLCSVPVDDMPPKQLMQRLAARLDHEVKGGSERRIVTLSNEELLVST
ncbi:MAG TPA: diguanylate cyclase [Ramlibacter sp.]|jgi:GGDEF domain-containing protein